MKSDTLDEARSVLLELERRGLTVEKSPDAHRLRIYPRGKLDSDLRSRLMAVKEDVIFLLSKPLIRYLTPENVRELRGFVSNMDGKLRFDAATRRFSIDLSGKPSRDPGSVLRAGTALGQSAPWLEEHLDELAADGEVEIIPVPVRRKPTTKRAWRWN